MVNTKSVQLLGTFAALICALSIAACGSSNKSSSTTGSAVVGQGITFADCVRAHGVPGFPDPGPDGGVSLPSTIDPQSPSYKHALADCAKLQPGAIGSPQKASERARIVDVEFSRCMRDHGMSDFPDPSFSVPGPGQAHGIIRGGMYWPLPAGIEQSPAFEKAATICGLRPQHAVATS